MTPKPQPQEKPGEVERCEENQCTLCGGCAKTYDGIELRDCPRCDGSGIDPVLLDPTCKGTARRPAAPAEPAKGWLREGLAQADAEATPEEKRRVAENPSGFFRGAENAPVEGEREDFYSGFDKQSIRVDPIGPTAELRARVASLESALAASKAEAEANLNAAASLEVVRDDLGRQLAASKARTAELQAEVEKERKRATSAWRIVNREIDLINADHLDECYKLEEQLSAATAENARLRGLLEDQADVFARLGHGEHARLLRVSASTPTKEPGGGG